MTSIRQRPRRMPALAIGLFLAALAISILSCANPLSHWGKGGKGSLAIRVRIPVLRATPNGAASPSSRVLTAQTVSMAAQLLRDGDIAFETSSTANAEGLFTLSFRDVPVGTYALRVSASDANGVYADSDTEIQLAAGENQQAIVLLPTEPYDLEPGTNAGLTIDAGRTAIYRFTADYAGTWTINLSGAPGDIQVFGTDGRPLASYAGGSRISLPMMAQGDSAYIAVYAGDTARTMAAAAAHSATSNTNPGYGANGMGAALGTISNSTDVIEDMVELSDGRIVAVGTSTPLNGSPQAFVAMFTEGLQPDTSFGGSGRIFLEVPGYTEGSEGFSCALQTIDGSMRIIIAGRCRNDGANPYRYFTCRVDLNGNMDINFNGDGYWIDGTSFADASNSTCGAPDCVVDTDQRLFVLMNSSSANPRMKVVRFLSDGTPDTGFGAGGLTISSTDPICPVAIALDNRISGSNFATMAIFLAGHGNGKNIWYVTRLNPDGTGTSGFGSLDYVGPDGNYDTQSIPWIGSTNATVSDMVVSPTQGEQTIFLSGTNVIGENSMVTIGALRADTGNARFSQSLFAGTPDPLFACQLGPNGHIGTSLAVDANGGTILCGNSIPANPDEPQQIIGIRVTTETPAPENPVTGFNNSADRARSFSIFPHNGQYFEAAKKVLIRQNGNYLFGGSTVVDKAENTYSDLLLFECPDSSEPVALEQHHPLRSVDLDFKATLVLDDGSLFAVGSAGRDAVIAKFLPDGSLDTTFGTGGIRYREGEAYDYPSSFNAITMDHEGNVIAAGALRSGGVYHGIAVSLDHNSPTWQPGGRWGSGELNMTEAGSDIRNFAVKEISDGLFCFGQCRQSIGSYSPYLSVYSDDGTNLYDYSIGSYNLTPTNKVSGIALGQNGEIFAAWEHANNAYIARFIWRDNSFTNPEQTYITITTSGGTVHDPRVFRDTDGSIYALARNNLDSTHYPFLARYNAQGTLQWAKQGLESGFSCDQAFTISGAIHPDGRFFAAGTSGSSSSAYRAAVNATNPDGNPDGSFGTSGTAFFQETNVENSGFSGAAISTAGDLMLSGFAERHFDIQGLTVSYR